MQASLPGARVSSRGFQAALSSVARALAVLASLAVAAFATAAPAAQEPEPDAHDQQVVHIKIGGPLDRGTHSLVRRGVERARATSRVLIVEFNTPGGEVELMFTLATQLADAHKEDGVLTVAWIHDRAYSAGALLALACEKLYMRPQSAMGAASVVTPAPDGSLGGIEDPTMEAKFSSSVRAIFRAFAEANSRPPALAEAMVDRMVGALQVRTADGELRVVSQAEYEDLLAASNDVKIVRTIAEPGKLVSLSGTEAVQFGMSDGLADSLNDVLGMVGFPGANVVSLERARSEDVATWLSSVHYLLIGIGVMALVAEFKAPGFGLAGVVAIVCFGLALFGDYLVGLADIPHLVAVGLGLALIAVELFLMPGTIWPGTVGAVLVVGGLVFAQFDASFFSSALGRELALDGALKLFAGIVLALVLGAVFAKFLPYTPVVGRLVQAPTPAFEGGAPAAEFVRAPVQGERGVALTPLRPVGKVRLSDSSEEVEARSAGSAIDAGATVRVVAVEGLRAVVEPEPRGSA